MDKIVEMERARQEDLREDLRSLFQGAIRLTLQMVLEEELKAMVGVRIRYYGFLANGSRARLLACCRDALAPSEVDTEPEAEGGDILLDLLPHGLRLCPHCKHGILRCVQILERPPPYPPRPRTHSDEGRLVIAARAGHPPRRFRALPRQPLCAPISIAPPTAQRFSPTDRFHTPRTLAPDASRA